jgi:UDP-N-acetylmuramoyl-tripeptide--D-alanyl-D-alanine ligase
MGANHPGEIAYTSHYAQADVSVITNVGAAHIAGFGDLQGVATTKGEIISNLPAHGVAVINRDDAFYPFWRELAGERQVVAFGFSDQAEVRASNIVSELTETGYQTRFELSTAARSMPVLLNLAGEHNVKNALAVVAVALQLGIEPDAITKGLAAVKPVTGRMQPLKGRLGNVVIDDTYNANPSSLTAALTVLEPGQINWLVLGAFGELGPDSEAIHAEMGLTIKQMPVQRLFATGELAKATVASFGEGAQFFDNQEQLISVLQQSLTGCETILVKGSRSQKMENVVAALVDNFRAA